MNPTHKKLKKLFKNIESLPEDDPIYKEPPGIIFTGIRRKTKKEK